ncbi:CAS/CSE protein, C-terminus [Nesidiocoris tenuis]|uniref:Exportin-2 n=3 Tax=Nesidiocoris tenuis TaxID=355587 RepID=A0ABN7AT71_9HEMI|nr:CAS/CSE protein, C-terminus [Nesidiocoris tenuis]
MDITEENLKILSNYLRQTLDPNPDVRRPSEKFLESVEANKNYPLLLLNLINQQSDDLTIKVAGAVTFKNYVKRNWPLTDDGVDKIHPEDREQIKELIVNIMLVSPPAVQKQLSDAINIIGKSDFPRKWPNLLSNMISKFQTGDFHVINGVLHTAHSIFKRYRYEFKSQELWEEIKFVLDEFTKPFTELFTATVGLITTHAANPQALKVIYSSLLLILKVFYSLNFQDLPEFFEDNIKLWMDLKHQLLIADVKGLESDSESEPGIIEELKAQIIANVQLYAQKYDEEFRPYLPGFVTDIWNLLVTTGLQTKYDAMVSGALQYLSTVAQRDHYKYLFENPEVLSGICENVIIPNIHFREMDEELFEDNPEEYIRRDIEGSDIETRRRAACDLVKILAIHFDEQVSKIFSQYVQRMLEEYRASEDKWRQKDTALYIVTCLAERGSTNKHGVTKTCSMVNLADFANMSIFPELAKDANTSPVIKADCIKYIIKFRSVLPPEMLQQSLPALIQHCSAKATVVHTYAALALEKLMIVRCNDVLIINKTILTPLAPNLLKGLFGIFDFPGSEENEYVMKAIMRSFSILDDAVLPFLGGMLPVLTQKLIAASKNPKKPHFNHYLFETLVLCIKIVCARNPGNVSSFEEALFPVFQVILQQDVQEFVPYVMQLLSMMLEFHPDISGPYLGLYPCLLSPGIWERTGNIKGLCRLIRSYIKKANEAQFKDQIKLPAILGIFQKLISMKSNDHEGFTLVQTMMIYCPHELLEPYIKQIFLLLFQRLTSSKTTKYIKCLLVFFCFFILRYGATEFIELVDSIQPMMFGMILEKLFIPDTQKIDGVMERKIAATGLSKLLCEGKQLKDGQYANQWQVVLNILANLVELPVDDSTHPEDHYVDVDSIGGYEGYHSELVYVGQAQENPIKGLVNASWCTQLAGRLSGNQLDQLKLHFLV